MPPVTRRAQAGSGGIAKKVTRKRAPATRREPSDSWNFVDTRDDDEDVRESVEQHHDQELEPEPELQAAVERPMDFAESVNPLREMADKVGREVERFAETLDQFLQELPTQQDKVQAAIEVVEQFKDIAEDVVRQLKKSNDRERRHQLTKEWSQRAQLPISSTAVSRLVGSAAKDTALRKAEDVKDLRHWQAEVDLWELLILKLKTHYNKNLRQDHEEKLAKLGDAHRYSTESEIWERFLLQDDMLYEHSVIKKWLEQVAKHQESDLPGIMEELEARSGAGKGLWSHGWMNTREKIKGEKRLRSWPSASDSVQPQIRSSNGNELLVTALDPDAPMRQQRALEQPDNYYERATWIACWEMVRRGTPWNEIKEWCESRNEGWRVAVLSDASNGPDALSKAAWRKMCYLASESGCTNEYEAAVYGLLSGNMKSVQSVCRGLDDYLHAYFSTSLVRQFELYMQRNHPEKVNRIATKSLQDTDSIYSEAKAQAEVTNIIKRWKQRSASGDGEAATPMKVIESYLLANQAESLVATVGTAISHLDSLRGDDENMIVRLDPTASNYELEAEVALDRHTLRIVAHMYIVLRSTEPDAQPDPEFIDAEENVLASYIQAIRAAGKRDHIPLYASRMQRSRAIVTMARMLQDVTQASEQQEILALMTQYEIDVVAVLTDQLDEILNSRLDGCTPVDKPLQILEQTEVGRVHPGQRIMVDFLPEALDEDDVAVVRSLQWFQLLRGHWDVTFQALSFALRKCLASGRFACALEIVRNFPYHALSIDKSHEVLGQSVDLMDKNLPWPEAGSDDAIRWELLKRQSQTYHDLEQLVRAVEALAHWAINERQYTSDPKGASAPAPAELREAKLVLEEAMAPLLAGILQNPIDEHEAADLQHIRTAYLPEIVLAYNTALYSAGATISRDGYIESMELSVAVAKESSGLSEAFVQAGRMRELVSSFAQTSKMMLVMKATGRPRKADRAGKDLGMWEIGPQGTGESLPSVS